MRPQSEIYTLSGMTSIPALSYGSPPPRATYMSAGLQDLKNVLFAHLEQEDFLLGRVTFEPEGSMQVSHLVTKSLAKAKKQWSCMGKQNVKAA